MTAGRSAATPLSGRHVSRSTWLALAAIFIAAALVRNIAMGSDLWLDEIWSLRMAESMHSALDIFRIHHDNNHPLNTLWLYLVGSSGSPFQYHLLSLISGIATVCVAASLGLRRSATTAVITMVLFAASYELVLSSSAARGYSELTLFAVLAFALLERYLAKPLSVTGVGYTLCAVFGLLAHPVFASVLAAATVWTLYRFRAAGLTLRKAVVATLMVQGVPLVFCVFRYFTDWRVATIGGGDPAGSTLQAYGEGMAWALSTPRGAAWLAVMALLAVMVLGWRIARMMRARDDRWVFFLGTTLVFPLLFAVLRGQLPAYPRYFIVAAVTLLLMLAEALAQTWESGRTGRLLCGSAVAIMLLLDGFHIAELARYGRGQHRDAVLYMVRNTPGQIVTVGGDHDFRIGMEIDYFMPQSLGPKSGGYIDAASRRPGVPEWHVTQRESTEPPVPQDSTVRDATGNEFQFVQGFPAAPLAGLHWFVYRRVR